MSLKNLAKMINQANKVKTPEQEFLFMLNQTISRLHEETKRQPSQSFKPSSLGGCWRRVYYEVTGAEMDRGKMEEASSVGILESGTDRHDRIQTAVMEMKRMGYDCEWIDVAEYLKIRPVPGTRIVDRKGNETKLKNDILNLSFMCDGIIKLNGKYYILEIKTEASFKFMSRAEVVEQHKVQATCYSVGIGIDNVIFLYENRDLCQKKTFEYQVTAYDKQDRVVHVIETVNNHIEEKTVPEKTTQQSQCKYCPFTGICKKQGDIKEDINYDNSQQ
jgi:CRISPR/Cas system-associated exonuclease Cas4 (RecB family)